jgi:hypothetical protein
LLIFGMVIAYLIIGLVAGATVTRVGYARDGDVKNALIDLQERAAAGTRGYYLEEVQTKAKKTIKRAKNFWVTWGAITIIFYPVLLPLVIAGAGAYGVGVLAWRGISYALNPPKAEADRMLVMNRD